MRAVLVYPGGRGTLPFGVPLGIASIAAVLRDSGHEVFIVDFRFQDEADMAEVIEVNAPQLIGFYASTDLASRVQSLGKAARRVAVKACLVVGGPHATISPEYFLRETFDVAVLGEGEATMTDLVTHLESDRTLQTVQGIAWRNGANVIANERRPFIDDLDSLPLPAYDAFPNVAQTMRSNLFWSNLLPFTHVLVSRGCPFSCSFCQPTLVRMFGKKVRRMSPNRVVDLLLWLERKFGVKEVFFEDDLFLSTAFKTWVYQLTWLMRERNVGVRWYAQARADSADQELLSAAREAGCYMVMCGVESGSQRILDFYHKRITPEQVRSLFTLCRELGLMTIAEIIFGAPMETRDDVKKTLKLIREIEPDGVSPCILTPYPGTYVSEWLIEHGVWFNADIDHVDRTVHRKRIDSPLTPAYLRSLALSSILTTPSLKLIIARPYYRRVYIEKIRNLISAGHASKALFLLLMSFPKPVICGLTYLYFALSQRVPFIAKLKNLIKH
ncbi:MAG: B12-binding domain-containing radical SAM protein [bacterium]